MRVVVGLTSEEDAPAVAEALRELGAVSVQGPDPSLPDVLIADVPDEDPTSAVERVGALPGVRYAEPDELQSIF